MKISRSIEWLSLPSRICAVFTPFSTALIHVSIFGIIPPAIVPSFISSRSSSVLIRRIRLSGSSGSARSPGTSVRIMSFSASIADAIEPATVSAFKLSELPSLSIPIGDITGM